jgi:hypothetical protein
MMNLEKLEAQDSAVIKIKDAAGQVLPDVSITLVSPGSDVYRKAHNAARRRNKKINEGDEAAFRDSNAELYADCTLAFNGLEYGDLTGRDLFLSVYTNPKLGYITNQVFTAVNDWGNFSASDATN